ncbi:MAG: alpha-amylase [Crocinitomicaceae bacterium]|nr:alpha-amylase [Crocinitomicaceae bacterium]
MVHKTFIIILSILLICCNSKLENNDISLIDKETSEKVNWKKNATIYELNVRQFSENGDFISVLPHLKRIKEMGIKIIWLMPIHPIGEKNRKGSLGSYYSIKDYQAINTEFGNNQDFKTLVDSIHSLGMKVIIDWVPNHTAFDNQWALNHKEWYTLDSLGNLQPPIGTDWWDVADLNYDNQDMRNAMKDALLYWVKEFDIDGYRCDVASWVPDDFWKNAIDTLKTIKPVFMLAEAEGKNMYEVGFDMTYNWSYMHVSNEIAKGKLNLKSLDSLLKVEDSLYNENQIRMYFTSNHDENSWNGTTYERYDSTHHLQTLLAFTMPGMPLLYNGQESAMKKRLRFFEKDTIIWGDYPLEDYYSTLLNLRINNSAMWSNESNNKFEKIITENEKIFAYKRFNNEDEVNIFLNFSTDTVLIENLIEYGNFYELFSNEKVENIKLLPLDGKILVKQ